MIVDFNGNSLCRNSNQKTEHSSLASNASHEHRKLGLDLRWQLDDAEKYFWAFGKKQQVCESDWVAAMQLNLWPWACGIYLGSKYSSNRSTFGKQPARKLRARGLNLSEMARSTATRLSDICCIRKLHNFRPSPVPRIGFGAWTLQQTISVGSATRSWDNK